MGVADLPRRHLADKFLHVAIAPANAYKFAKIQLPSSISYGDNTWRGHKIKSGSCSPRTPLAEVFANAYQCTKFQLPSSISFGDMKGVPKYCVLTPIPCMNTRLSVYRVLKSVQRPEL